MAIRLSAEEFRSRFGDAGISQFGVQAPQASQQGFGQGVQEAFGRAGERISSAFGKSSRNEQNPLSTSIQAVGAGAGLLGDILFQGLKAITPDPVEEAVEAGIKKVTSQPSVQNIMSSVNKWAVQHPEAAANLGSILDIAAVAPLGKVAQVGARAVGAGARATGRTAGQGLALAGAAGEKTGKKVISASFTPTIEQAQRTINFQAKSTMLERLGWAAKDIEKAPQILADTIIKYNLSGLARGNIGARAKKASTNLFENQVNPALSAITERASKKTLFESVRRDINKVPDISRRKGLLDAFDALADDYKHVSGWSYKTLNKIKSDMSKRLPSKVWKGQEIAGDLNNVRVLFAAQARQTIRNKLPKQILDAFDDYGSLVEITARGAKSLTRGFDAGILGITSEAIRVLATPITSIGGRGIFEAGKAVKKVGQALQR